MNNLAEKIDSSSQTRESTPTLPSASTPIYNAIKQSVFWGIHLCCLATFFVGVSKVAIFVCLALYVIRMFAITGGYHRYFSHRSYKTSRFFQFCLAWLGASSAQKGPLWWASHHRHHHQHSDTKEDVHSAQQEGLWWSHIGWILSSKFVEPRPEMVKDLIKFPEIRWVDQYHIIPPFILAIATYYLGAYLGEAYNTSGWQMLVVGFFVSTTLLYHGTFTVNSITHMWGKKRFVTGDESRNSLLIALFTLGEGWHNNHHRYPGSERQGFYWWEIDISHYILKVLSWFGLVWDLRIPPARIYEEAATGRSGS